MEHLGDITKLDGHTLPPVDVIIGGSPCQDLSVSGKRAGLAGERSGLFMEQIRIIKEMREEDMRRGRAEEFIRPRYMVFENVPGLFSSNGGNDFKAVLEETIRIAEPDAPDIPLPPKGKWPMADCWMGDGWSIAYRVLDAQFWGVPQRRRRIALVADFGGHCAPEILFVRQGVCGDNAESGPAGEEAAAGAGSGADCTIWNLQGNAVDRDVKMNGSGISQGPMYSLNTVDRHAVFCLNDQGGNIMGTSVDIAGTLRAQEHGHQPIVCAGFQHKAGARANGIGYEEEKAPTITSGQQSAVNIFGKQIIPTLVSSAFKGPGNTQDGFRVYDARGNGDGKTACTLTWDHQSRVTDYTAIVMATGQAGAEILEGLVPTLNCNHEQPIIAHTLRAQAQDPHDESLATYPITDGILRRLTPTECEKLQGYPPGYTDIGPWTDSKGKLHKESSDSARYKALGNSIAFPPWKWVLKRLCACYERDATMGSLFDGIGGFPLIWERLNGPGSCLWASEIEEFPIAVTKYHFGG